MFPIDNFNVEDTQDSFGHGISFDFDFAAGDFILVDGKLKEIDGKKALDVWVNKIIDTDKDKFDIYKLDNESYGLALKDYLYNSKYAGLVYANIQKELETSLTVHPDIYSLNNFEFIRNKRSLNVSFIINTKYGAITEGVTIQ